MLTWMLYVVLITLLLSGAALAAEYGARLHRARSRWIWVLTIVASLVIPTIIASVSIQVPSLLTPTVSRKITALREMTSVQVAPLTWVRQRTGNPAVTHSLNVLLQRSWMAVSVALLAALVLNGAQVLWRKWRWKIATIAGASVYIAPDVGPAVVGLLRPRIVVPTWLTETSPSHQAMVIAHEQAHLAAHDPQVLTVAPAHCRRG
jgi:bla regulator protein blaR1